MMESHDNATQMEERFEEHVKKKFPPEQKRSTSGVIYAAFGEKIKNCLKNPELFSKEFRHYVKKKNFRVFEIPSIGLKDVLVIPRSDSDKETTVDNSLLKQYRRIVFVEEFYSTIKQIHFEELLHAGYKKTFEKISSIYYGIPRSIVEAFVSMCNVCQQKKSQHNQAPLKPIISHNFLSRLQVDLIDMRHLPDGEYKWICHAIDHWSKFNFAFPIETKEAESVASVFETYIFPYFGVPKIFQSDNGKEFVNSVIEKLLHSWSTDIQIIQGRPRHPQSQGVIERAHRTLEQKLATQLESTRQWSKLLPRIVYSMNIQVHETTGHSPYELVFGQKPHATIFPGGDGTTITNEEDLELDGIVFEGNEFEGEYGMNIFDDDHERNNQEAGHCHDREDETGASQEQNTDKEEFDFGKCQVKVEPEYDTYKDGTVESEADKETGKCHDLTDDIRSEQNDKKDELDLEKCHVTVEHEYDKQNDIIVDFETDNEADYCSDQRDEEKVFDLEKTHGNVESNCEQFEKFENEADSDKEGKTTTSESHSKVREHARERFMKAATKMANRYNVKNAAKFKEGDLVTIRIPKIDRTSTDMPRLPCLVVEVRGKAQESYRLRCEHGIINKLYPASELEGYTGELPFNSNDWEDQPKVSLRQAAALSNPWNHFLANSCRCTQGCTTKRCRCVRNGIECSTHCHNSKMCCNKKNDRDSDKVCNQSKEEMKTLNSINSQRLARISQTKPQWLLEAKIKSYKLYDNSFLSLIYNTGWVSDEIISAYLHVLVQVNDLKESVQVIDVSVANKICNGKFYLDNKKLIKLDISNFDKTIGAFHQGGNHWVLLVIEHETSTITYLDPKGEKPAFVKQLTKQWNDFSNHQYLSECWKKPYKWKIITKAHCKQKDGHSCGVHVMKFAECILKKQALPDERSKLDVYKLRNDMAVQLLEASEPLDEYCHSCGMRDLSTDCDDDWVKCDCCDWWYHLQCINRKRIGNYSMEDVESLEFKGPCCSANGQFSFN